mmetsp:Transcript_13875/g.33341  ORF Transcript_13875/g.33341 Transcript_13875/m.33341 type:complete len:389 (+) Transcript_13875:340-1506(+)
MVLGLEFLDTFPVTPLCVSVDVHFDDTIANRLLDIRHIRTRATMEHKHDGLLVCWCAITQLLRNVVLCTVQNLGLQLNVSGRVNTVNVSKSSSNREGRRDGSERLVHLVDLLRLRVQVLNGSVRVVDAIFFPTSDAQFHFQQDSDLGHAFQVVLADFNIFLNRLFRQVNHVTGEQGFAMILKVTFRSSQEPVNPRQKLLGTVVGVQNDRNSVLLGHSSDVEGPRDGTGDGSFVVCVVQSLATVKLTSTRTELDNDGSIVLARCFQASVDSRATDTVHGRNGVSVFLGVVEKIQLCLTRKDSRVDGFGKIRVASEGAFIFAGNAQFGRNTAFLGLFIGGCLSQQGRRTRDGWANKAFHGTGKQEQGNYGLHCAWLVLDSCWQQNDAGSI